MIRVEINVIEAKKTKVKINNVEKSFDNIHHSFVIKKNQKLQKVGIEGMNLNIIKVIYNKPTGNILNGEKLFPVRLGTRQECSLSPLSTQSGSPGHGNQRRKGN